MPTQPTDKGDWTDYLPWMASTGARVAGTILDSRAQNQQNERLDQRTAEQDQIARDEMKRREYYASILMPSLLQGIGNRNPNLMRMAQARQRALPGYGGRPPQRQGQTGTVPNAQGVPTEVQLQPYEPGYGNEQPSPEAYDPALDEDFMNWGVPRSRSARGRIPGESF